MQVFDLVHMIREAGIWSEAPDATGEAAIPMEMLVLSSLKVSSKSTFAYPPPQPGSAPPPHTQPARFVHRA